MDKLNEWFLRVGSRVRELTKNGYKRTFWGAEILSILIVVLITHKHLSKVLDMNI